MTIASVIRGPTYPDWATVIETVTINQAMGTVDAATEKVAVLGRLLIEGRATGKVISAAGGGSIAWRAQGVTWANASTALDVGLQDVDLASGNPARPDGTFDVKKTLVPGTDALANGGVSTAMTGGSGSKTLSHGDWIAVVWDMTARAGSDAVQVGSIQFGGPGLPYGLTHNGSAWSAVANQYPQVGIVFDDGTRAQLDGTIPLLLSSAAESFADATNPDERGMSFEMPWDTDIDAIVGAFSGLAANGDFEFQIYSDPFGTPASVLPGGTAIAVTAESLRAYSAGLRTIWPLVTPVSLTRNTRYAVTVKATGAGSASLASSMVLHHEGWKQFTFGGLNASKVTRNNGSGAFTEAADTIYPLGVRISGWHDTDGGGGGGARQKVYGG